MNRTTVLSLAIVLFSVLELPTISHAAEPDREELEKQFAEKLSGATLVGHFTLGESPAAGDLKTERYRIKNVSKLAGDTWLFQTGVQYGEKKEVFVPLPLEVKWAGDTPVITLTELALPLLGTYTARVLIYGDQYAGTWSGGDHGGHLFGKITRENSSQDKENAAEGGNSPATN